VAISGLSFADPNYVQALPGANPPKATVPANQASHDAFGQPIDQIQSVADKPQKAVSQAQQPAATSSMDDSAQNTLLLSRVMQVNQDFLNFQSKTADQINQLQSANQQLAQQISTLAGQLAMLQTKMSSQAGGSVNDEAGQQTNSFRNIENEIGAVPFYIIVGIFILLVVIIVLLLFPRKKEVTEKPKEDVKSDYDYLSTKEAIPAKLDLARSYIVMEDFEAAKKVLDEVLNVGDDAQKVLANNLLKECEPEKNDG
jgi:FimV-like protein